MEDEIEYVNCEDCCESVPLKSLVEVCTYVVNEYYPEGMKDVCKDCSGNYDDQSKTQQISKAIFKKDGKKRINFKGY